MKAILAYIFGWIGGLIVLLALKDNSRNTKIHAAQAIVLSGGYTLILIILMCLPFGTGLLSWPLQILYILGVIFGIVKANKEEEPELPVIGDIAKSIFAKQIDEQSGE